MFGLTKREQRWAAEQRAAETMIPLLTASIANNSRISQYEAEISRLNARVTELETANKILETEEANIILKLRKQLSSLCDENDFLAQEADLLYRSKVYSGR
jgi:cell division protein FtsB